MKKKLEENVAEIVIITLLIIILSSCASTAPVNVGTGTSQFRSCGAWISK